MNKRLIRKYIEKTRTAIVNIDIDSETVDTQIVVPSFAGD